MMVTKGELMFELEERVSAVIVKDVGSKDAKIEISAQGQVSGKYSATRMETVDAHLKPLDGTGDWELRGIDITREGDVVLISGKGTGRRESSGSIRIEGEVSCKTASKRLDWLNSTKFWIEGTRDIAAGKISAKIYARE